MTLFILPAIYGALLFFERTDFTGKRERYLYRVLVIIALVLSLPASYALSLDHVGASLSGLVSVFSR